MFEDWMQRYEYIIESGKSLPQIENECTRQTTQPDQRAANPRYGSMARRRGWKTVHSPPTATPY